MIPSIPIPWWIAQFVGYGLVGAGLLAAGAATGAWAVKRTREAEDLESLDLDHGSGFKMTRYVGKEGRLSSLMRSYGRRRKKEEALSDGHVRWHVVGSTFSEPMYVHPEPKEGGNTPEIERDDQTYLFPKQAMVPSAEDGVPVVIHREGEADPIELPDEWDLSLDANTLRSYLDQRVTSTAPKGGLGGIPGLGFLADADPMELLQYTVIGMIFLFLAMEFV